MKSLSNETSYIEACLWLSLEAMIKLLSTTFTLGLPQEYADLVISASQLAFEYGRYVLYKKEQAILEKYIENQYILDDQLQREYEEYLEEVQIQSQKFQHLVDNAFSIDIHQALEQSVALAREAGVEEENIEYGDTTKGILAFGDITLKPEEIGEVQGRAREKMEKKLEETNSMQEAERFAKLSVWEIYQPIVNGVSPECTLEVEFQ